MTTTRTTFGAAMLAAAIFLVSFLVPVSVRAQACPTSGSGIQCFNNTYFCASSSSCYAQPSCTGGKEWNCTTCGCACPTSAPNDCSSANGLCQANNGSCAGQNRQQVCDTAGGSTTRACGGCSSGYQDCDASAAYNCRATTSATCAAPRVYDPCTGTCTEPYITANPSAPQSANINLNGLISTTGNLTVGGDVFLSSGKAIRMDGSGVTNLYFGNWGTGGTALDVHVLGSAFAQGISTLTGDASVAANTIETGILRILSPAAASSFVIRNAGDTLDLFRVDQTGTLQVGAIPWERLATFPTACPAGQFVSAIGGTLTCATPAGGGGSGTVDGSGTAGRVTRFSGTTTLTDSTIFDNGTNVGIGAASAGAKLDVAGTVRATGLQLPTGAANGRVLTSDASGTATWQVPVAGDTLPSGTVNQTLRHAGAGWASASNLLNDGTNISLINGDLSVSSTKSINVPGASKTSFSIGNWQLYPSTDSVDFNVFGRTFTSGLSTVPSDASVPANTIETGTLCLGADCRTIWPSTTTFDPTYLNTAGDTMTGDLVLSGVGTDLTVGGKTTTTTLQVTAGAANGRVLTSDASGNATWQLASTGLPTGTSGQTLRHDGANWVASGLLTNNGTDVAVAAGNLVMSNTKSINVPGASKTSFSIGNWQLYPSTDSVDLNVFGRTFTSGLSTVASDTAVPADTIETGTLCLGADCRTVWPSTTTFDPTYMNANGDTMTGDLVLSGVGTDLTVGGKTTTTTLQVTSGAATGRVLTADASGNATWQPAATSLPTGTSGQTLRHDGTNWVASSILSNDGAQVGVNVPAPLYPLDVAGDASSAIVRVNGGAAQWTGLQLAKSGFERWYLGMDGGNTLVFRRNGGINDMSVDSVTGRVTIGTLRISGGAPGTGKVLTSDASGNATWEAASTTLDPTYTNVTGDTMTGDLFLSGGGTDLTVGGKTTTTSFQVIGGAPGTGKVLTSDASGNATWQTAATGLPSGTASQTLRHNGTSWVSASDLTNDGTNVSMTGDLFMANGKAIRADGSGTTSLSIGNWGAGGTAANLYVFGASFATGLSTVPSDTSVGANTIETGTLCLGTDCRTTWPSAATFDPTYLNTDGDTMTGDLVLSGVGTDLTVDGKTTTNTLQMTGGAPGAGKVLTSDASGNATWQTVASGLPSGSANQTFRHDGTGWVASGSLSNSGTKVGVNAPSPSYPLDVGTDGSSAIGRFNGAAAQWTGLQLAKAGSEKWYVGMDSSNDNLLFRRNGSSNAVFIDSASGTLTTGSFQVTGGSPGAGMVLTSDASGNATWQSVPASTGFANNGNSYGTLATIGTNDNFDLSFETGGLARMRLDTSGRLGIGVNNPNVLLNIGTSGATAISMAGGGVFQLGQSITKNVVMDGDEIQARNNGAASDLLLQFQGGNVGIGASSASRLTVAGEARVDGFKMPTDAAVGRVLTSDANGVGTWQAPASTDTSNLFQNGGNAFGEPAILRTTDAQPLYLGAGGNEGMLFLDDGRVWLTNDGKGFGIFNVGGNYVTLKAPYPLGADYTLTFPTTAGTSGQVLSTNGTGAMSWVTMPSVSNFFENGGNDFGGPASIGTNDINSLSFRTNDATRMTIATNGNVGIGDTNPAAELTVNGKIRVKNSSALRLHLGVNAISALDNDAAGTLLVNQDGGTVLIGSVAIPSTSVIPLVVQGGTDAEAGSGGYLMLGASTGENVVIDNNEIMARNNGVIANLHLRSPTDVSESFSVYNGTDAGASLLIAVDGSDDATANNNWAGFRIDRKVGSVYGEKWFVGMNDVDDDLVFRRSGTSDDLTLRTNGNLGVGQALPGYKLDVNGTGRFSDTLILDHEEVALDANGALIIGSTSGANLAFDSGEIQARSSTSAATLFLQPHGGLTDLGAGADVAGTMNATRITVDGTSGIELDSNWLKYFDGNFYIDASGSVTIGAASGGRTYLSTIEVQGTAYKSGSLVWTSNSDARVKKDIRSFSDGLETALKLRPVTYRFNGLGGTEDDGKEFTGLIAQEVLPVAPYMIGTDPQKLHAQDEKTTDIYTLDATALMFINLNSIKELNAKVEDQAGHIEELEARLRALEKKLR